MSRRAVLLVLLALAICLYFVDLGGSSIWDANEAFYVETPREMIETGDYISPTFNYEPRLNKPVLSYWIVAAFYKVFGVSVGVQRVPIAIGAMVLIATAFLLARAAWPVDRAAAATEAGLWAAVGLAVSPRLLMFARRIFIDIYVSMFMGLSLLFFALSERHPARRRSFLALMYVAAGLGTLTKGPVALVLPGLAVGIYLVLHRELRRIRELMIVPGILIVSAIVVPWYAALYLSYGWTYITSFLLAENLARYTEGVGVNAVRGPFFYLPVVFSDPFPWSLLLVAAGVACVRMWRRPGSTSAGVELGASRSETPARSASAAFRVETLLWLWILTIVGFFTLSTAKQDLYIFPIVPAVGALGGLTIARAISSGPSAVFRWSLTTMGAVLLVLGLGVIYLFQGAAAYALSGATAMGLLASFGGGVGAILAGARRTVAALVVVLAALVTVNWVFVLRVLPSFERYKPAPGLAQALAARAVPEDVIATYNVALPSLVYYLRRHVDVAYDPEPILAFLSSDRRAFVVMSRADYHELDPYIEGPTCVLSSHSTFDVKLRSVLTRDPLPELLLITNRCGR